ncbi:MAG: DUF4870 domain-containing protein [Pseudolysinimonas sp.]|uniref:DUF4870 domain-containing protein n=1 Tax=Pseudolysinimonas sp. TaxID=2680009 RepID=UPI00326679F8
MTTPQPAAPAPQPPLTAAEDQQWASFAHFGNILTLIPPLIIWVLFKDRGAKSNVEGKEALNFGITVAIIGVAIGIVNGILGLVTLGFWFVIGWILPVALWVFVVLFSIQGGTKVSAGGSYRYPFAIRFIK